MAPTSTSVTIKLTEPFVFLVGGTEHERARARRRRGLTRNNNSQTTPSTSRPNSRPSSPGPNFNNERGAGDEFILPGPSRIRDRERRSDSPLNLSGGGNSRSGSRARGLEGLTTGSGTIEEAELVDEPPPAMLRGLLTLTLAKPSRIRDISIRLKGIARTDWPEGIGPRRLDVLEETILTSNSWSFFSASESERRAVSIGPGFKESSSSTTMNTLDHLNSNNNNNNNLDDRGRTSSRRSVSMMSSRDTSIGHTYSSTNNNNTTNTRNNAIHEDEQENFDSIPTTITTTSSSSNKLISSPLSRITSSSNIVDSISPSSSPSTTSMTATTTTTDQWGPSPAYEAVSSVPNSPAQGPSSLPYSSTFTSSPSTLTSSPNNNNNNSTKPTLGRMNSLDSFDLTSPSNPRHSQRPRTPSRSPLNPYNNNNNNSNDSPLNGILNGSNSSGLNRNGRPLTGSSQLGQNEDHYSPDVDSQERIPQSTLPTARPPLVHMNSSGGDSLNWTSSSSAEGFGTSNNERESSGAGEERGRTSRRDPPGRSSAGTSNTASLASINGSGSDTNTTATPDLTNLMISVPPLTSSSSNSLPPSLQPIPQLSATTTSHNNSQSSLVSPSSLPPPSSLYRVTSPETLLNARSSSMSSRSKLNIIPSAPPPARSASRFSLAGLSDKLRGKSSSRARDSSAAGLRDAEITNRGGRTESPDTRGGGNGRDQSRGRRTALKSLRDALTSPMEVGEEEGSGDDFDGDDDGTNMNSKGKGKSKSWKEFKAGTYTYPISIPIPASLPPSINADFGNVTYMLKATIHRAGALTTNLTTSTEVTLVSAPGLDDTEENESIVVERYWETQMRYHIALSGKSFLVGGTIPISIRLHPLAKIKLYRITITLEQKTNYFASGRKLTRHETPKKFPLLRIENKDPKEALLPIFTDGTNAIHDHPLGTFFINPTSSDDTTPSLLDPIGPWFLEGMLKLPVCATRCNFSTNHEKANITVSHMLKIVLRVERGDDDFMDSKGKRKLWDVIIETPVHILSCRCAKNTLPAYSYTAPGAGPSGSISSTLSSTPNAFSAPDCGFNHSASAPSLLPPHPNLARSVVARPSTPLSQTQSQANTTLEQSLLFARLVAGEETPNGEVPPTYETAVHASPTIGTGPIGAALERSRSSSSSINSSIMTARVGRTGRSSSAVSGGSGGSGGATTASGRGRSASSNFGRSPSSHNGRSMSSSQNGRSMSTSTNGRSPSSNGAGGGRSDSISTEDRVGRSGSVGVVVRAGRSGSIVTMRGEPDY